MDGEAVVRDEGGLKEGKSLNTIPLGVGKEAVGVNGVRLLLERVAKTDNAGAAVEDNALVTDERFYADGVAAIALIG